MMVVKEEVSKIEIDSLQLSFHVRHDRIGRMRKMKKYGIQFIEISYLLTNYLSFGYTILT